MRLPLIRFSPDVYNCLVLMPEQEIEGSGRVYFWLAMPSIAIGLALAYLSVVRIVAAAEHRVTVAVAGRSVSEPPRGLFRWRRTELH